MMILYKKQLGSRDLNVQAYLIQKDLLEPVLKGLNCDKCRKDTVIEFFVFESEFIDFRIRACCDDFKKKIENNLV